MYEGRSYTLLSFWEAELETVYSRGQKYFWMKAPVVHFRNWARDAATAVCSQVYGAMHGNNITNGTFELDEELYQKWLKLAASFTMVGGERLAAVLEDIHRHERHKDAYDNGQVPFHRWHLVRAPLNFGRNAGIACVVVPAWLGLLMWHGRSGVRREADHRKL